MLNGDQPKLTALIVDPDGSSRMRLRAAIGAIPSFKHLEQSQSILQALSTMNSEAEELTVIIIASSFGTTVINEFFEKAKETKRGSPSARILKLDVDSQNAEDISKGIFQGADGFLCEPFSVVALSETTKIALDLFGQRKRERMEAAITLIIEDLTRMLDQIALNLSDGKPPGAPIVKLRNLGTTAKGLEEDLHPFFQDLMIKKCEDAQPRKVQSRLERAKERVRQKQEEDEARKKLLEEAAAQGLATRQRIIRKR